MDQVRVKALLFDVFGTVVDWRSSVTSELEALGEKSGILPGTTDWAKFAHEWRMGYVVNTRRIADGGQGPSSVDVMHREILDGMLKSDEWFHLGAVWDESTREELNLVWHRLKAMVSKSTIVYNYTRLVFSNYYSIGWPDTVQGLLALKNQVIIATLSNGNVRLLVDMAKHANLPWDMIFSTELFDTFKPNPKAYLQAIHHLSLPPSQCAMVAAHIQDLRAAANVGMKTVYVRRVGEDPIVRDGELVKSKDEGGEVDCVVDSFLELSKIISSLQ